jgi:hypothetical protein
MAALHTNDSKSFAFTDVPLARLYGWSRITTMTLHHTNDSKSFAFTESGL